MPRPDAAKIIASQLHDLPNPSGPNVRLLHHSSFGHSEDIQKKVADRSLMIGNSIVNLLESNGYRITHASDPVPVDQPGRKEASAHCAHCGCEVLKLDVDDNLKATLTRVALQTIGHPHDCWSK